MEESMKNKIIKFTHLLFCLVLLVGLGLSSPSAWAKHGHKYKYIYYPGAQVYYSPVAHRYYYLSNGAWIYAVQPPPTVRLGRSVSVQLGGPVPYVYHPTVIQQYPVIISD